MCFSNLQRQAARTAFLSSSALLLLWGTPGFTADFQWTGTESTDWYTANNWLEDGAATSNTPKTGDNVSINTTNNAPVLPTDGGTEYINTFVIGDTATGRVTSNATINGERTQLGASATGNGTLTLGGGGAIQMDNSIIVGGSGSGRIDMSAGATGQTSSIILGSAADSVGTVTLSGSGTSLRTYGTGENGLSVANSGSGTLSVSNGAFIESDQAIIGRESGAEGRVTLSGATTEWNGYGATTIGSSGKGTVLVQNGAHAISGSLSIGQNATSQDNDAIVAGSGSLWNVYQDISIGGDVGRGGSGGSGTLSVLDGATMTGSNGYIGNVANGEGSVIVDGTGSQLQLSASLRVGRNGDGSMIVSNGGSVTADFALVGANQSSGGIMAVTGAGSNVSLTNRMTVGTTGDGFLALTEGGALNSNGGIIGRDAGSVGAAGVSTGAIWTNTSNLEVGSEGAGLLTIFDGGTVTNRTAEIGTTVSGAGAVIVSGVGSSWAVDGGITAGVEGDGSLLVVDGGVVTSTASSVASAAGPSGLAAIDGAGSSWTIEGDLIVGENGEGVLALSDGGTLVADNLVLASNVGSMGALVIGSIPEAAAQAPGTLDVNTVSFGDGQGYLVFNHTSKDYEFSRTITGKVDIAALAGRTVLTADNTNEGDTYIDTGAEIQVGNGGTTGTLNGNATIETGGELSFARSDDIAFTGLLRGTGSVSQKGSGTLRLTADNNEFAGTLEADSGTFLVVGALRGTSADVKAGAAFGGSGEIGSTTVRTGGTFLSGDEDGSITVNGDLAFETDATYAAVIQTSQVPAKVSGTVSFDDTEIDLDFVDGGELKQQYTLLEAGAITGTWDAPLAALPSQFRGTIEQDANRLNMSLAYVGGNFNFSALGGRVNDQLVRAFNDGVPLVGTLSAGMLQSGAGYEAAMTTLGGELGVNATMTANLGMQNFLRRSSNPNRLLAGWRPVEQKSNDDELPSAENSSALGYWSVGPSRSAAAPQWDWAEAGRGSTASAYAPMRLLSRETASGLNITARPPPLRAIREPGILVQTSRATLSRAVISPS
nr:hypothetical protein [Marinicella sp. W31]MDC2877134.1 hypothetical protein [Marinicella sp. W31]